MKDFRRYLVTNSFFINVWCSRSILLAIYRNLRSKYLGVRLYPAIRLLYGFSLLRPILIMAVSVCSEIFLYTPKTIRYVEKKLVVDPHNVCFIRSYLNYACYEMMIITGVARCVITRNNFHKLHIGIFSRNFPSEQFSDNCSEYHFT